MSLYKQFDEIQMQHFTSLHKSFLPGVQVAPRLIGQTTIIRKNYKKKSWKSGLKSCDVFIQIWICSETICRDAEISFQCQNWFHFSDFWWFAALYWQLHVVWGKSIKGSHKMLDLKQIKWELVTICNLPRWTRCAWLFLLTVHIERAIFKLLLKINFIFITFS